MAESLINAELIGANLRKHPLQTPALLLDRARLIHNIAAGQAVPQRHGVHFRPHAKSHKCHAIVRRQIEAGATGICVASIREAEAFASRSVGSILLTSTLAHPAKVARFAVLGRGGLPLLCAVDSVAGIELIAAAARAAGNSITLLVDLDIGMGRAGVSNASEATALALAITELEGVSFGGFQAYSRRFPGAEHLYPGQLDRLRALITACIGNGVTPEIVSGGSTATLALDCASGLYTEHQAGSYVFADESKSGLFLSALMVRTTVLGRYGDRVLVDAGFKALVEGDCAPQMRAPPAPDAAYRFYGDEHGIVAPSGMLAFGDQIDIVPPRGDPTINLHDAVHVIEDERLIDIWPISARGVL